MGFRFPRRAKYYIFPLWADLLWGISSGDFELPRAGKPEVHEDHLHPSSVEVKTRGALPPFRIYLDVKVYCFVTHNVLDTGHKRERQQSTDGIIM